MGRQNEIGYTGGVDEVNVRDHNSNPAPIPLLPVVRVTLCLKNMVLH